MTEFFKQWYGIVILVLVDLSVLLALIAFTYRWLFKRVLDFLSASVCLLVLSPFFAVVSIRGARAKKRGEIERLYHRDEYVGKRGRVKELLTFERGENGGSYGAWLERTGFYKLPRIVDIWLGKLSFIGPKPYTETECESLTDVEMDRLLTRPGLIEPYRVLGGENEIVSSEKYAWGFSLFMDMKIFFTWLLGKIRS